MNNYSTPCYILDKEEVDARVAELNSSIAKYWKNTVVGFSYKTNSLKYIIEYMKAQGFLAEVVSDDELELALSVGYNYGDVIYNGPIKSKKYFRNIITDGGFVNIDSEREIDWLNEINIECSIGIRINFDIEKYCQNESAMGNKGGRFGFCFENGELERVITLLRKNKKINIAGIHLHSSSKTRSVNIYRAICNIAIEIINLYNLKLKYIDIGGGFFGGVEGKPCFDDYLREIDLLLGNAIDKNETTLIIEPGISLVGACFSYHTKVIDIKKTSYATFCISDGSRIHIDPLFHRQSFLYDIKYSGVQQIPLQVISGFTCMEDDRTISLENCVEVKIGDEIRYNKIGAYSVSLAPLFIKYFPEIYVNDKGKFSLIREKWTTKEYLQKQRGI